jgi:hypothetical protein
VLEKRRFTFHRENQEDSMMKRIAQWSLWAVGLALLVGLNSAPAAAGDKLYEVTVTNLTKGQIISPPIVYNHRWSFQLFSPGEPAIPELAAVAEDADSAGLVDLLMEEPDVGDVVVAEGVVPPGGSMTVQVRVQKPLRYISALGMLVTTNDAFFAGTTAVPRDGRSFYSNAWDAGSEANTQDCDDIPGPPCGSPFQRVTTGAEGYVFIHAGIQDRGDLTAEGQDWRNPVARIEIRRVKGGKH